VGVGLNPLYRVHSSGDIKADWNLRAGDSVYTSGVKPDGILSNSTGRHRWSKAL
jgi:hypothetical protein